MSNITVHIMPNHLEEVRRLFPDLDIKTDLEDVLKTEGMLAASYEPLVNAGYMNRVDIYGWK